MRGFDATDNMECQNCAFYVKDTNDEDFGFCKRYPPVYMGQQEDSWWSFPVLYSTDWCGEFQRGNN